jgi:hypothetical protein
VDRYVQQVASRRDLVAVPYPKVGAVDSLLFYTYYTDYPCMVVGYYDRKELVKVTEVIRTNSRVLRHQFYLRKGELVRVDEEHIKHEYRRHQRLESGLHVDHRPGDVYFHGVYYLTDGTVVAQREHGDPGHFTVSKREYPTRAAFFTSIVRKYEKTMQSRRARQQ